MSDPGGKRRVRATILIANGLAVAALAWVLWSESGTVEAEATGGARGQEHVASGQEGGWEWLLPPEVEDRRTSIGRAGGGALVVAPPAPPVPSYVRSVEARIDEAAREAARRSKDRVNARTATVAVCVVDVDTGEELVAIQADRPLRPASNLKILTTAAALVLLGPDARFETRFEAAAPIRSGVLEGDLVARAGGDPWYAPEAEGGVERWLDDLAVQLKGAGVERVSGRLVLDEGSFEAPGPGPAWPSSKEYWKEYCALAGGFSANAGCLTAIVGAAREGAPARVEVRPRSHGLRRRGEVKTAAASAALTVAVGATTSGVTVRGSIPSSVSSWSARFAAPDPVELFGHAVVGGLAARGVRIDGGFVRERGFAAGEAVEVALLGTPIAETMVPVLTHSNNSVADQLFLKMGLSVVGEGTRAGGAEAVGRALDALGLERGGWVQVGGSGLSRENRVSPRQLCGLVRAVRAGKGPLAAGAELFETAMPVAGETGTLEKRMRSSVARGRVHAKTGFINGTSGLSGWLVTESGRELAFSILVAYPTADGLNTHCWKPMQDAICAALVVEVDG